MLTGKLVSRNTSKRTDLAAKSRFNALVQLFFLVSLNFNLKSVIKSSKQFLIEKSRNKMIIVPIESFFQTSLSLATLLSKRSRFVERLHAIWTQLELTTTCRLKFNVVRVYYIPTEYGCFTSSWTNYHKSRNFSALFSLHLLKHYIRIRLLSWYLCFSFLLLCISFGWNKYWTNKRCSFARKRVNTFHFDCRATIMIN